MSELIDALVKELSERAVGEKHDITGAPTQVGFLHGIGGVLSFPGVDPVIYHSIMGTRSIMGQLPTSPSLYTAPTYYTLTGVQTDSGSEAEADCDPSPTAGLLKACLTTSVFGRYKRQTPVIELNRLGSRVDRADPMDLTLVGSPIHGAGVFTQGVANPETPGDLLVNEVSKRMWELAISMHRLLSQDLWGGSPANDAGQIGSRKQMTGFATLVNTGYVDIETNQACAAVDSYVRDFGSVRVDTAPGVTNIVAAITDMWYQVNDRALRTGVMPVRWVFAMRAQLFYELTRIWPCSYLSYRCTLSGNNTNFIDAQDATRLRDEMQNGKYLLIDGVQVPVIVDDGIPELDGNDGAGAFPRGCFSSDIYLIPMSVVGGRAVTFMEYFQYSNPSLEAALGNMVLGKVDGAFLVVPIQTRQCFQFEIKIEPRLVLRTPWLASRLQNVVYCPIQHERDAFPADPYFTDGGRTSRQGPSYYSLWGGSP